MNRKIFYLLALSVLILGSVFQINSPSNVQAHSLPLTAGQNLPIAQPAAPTPTPSATQAPSTQTTTSTNPGQSYGPDNFPANINPLTGLEVSNPESLTLPPAMVSISNFPVSARPQAGLSYSPFVYELYIGEGMSRFLAMFYGEYPQSVTTSNPSAGGSSASNNTSNAPQPIPSKASKPAAADEAAIGPIRSGRLPYESMRKLYNGFLIMSSAYSGVASNLSQFANVFGSDQDINAATIKVTQLETLAKVNQNRLGASSLSGLRFDAQPPAGGKPAQSLWFYWSLLNQVFWRYDQSSGAYLRYQDNADGKTFIKASDRLNSQPLTYENVVILYANHRYCTETAYDIDLMYITRQKALIFRDGQVYDAYWTTRNEDYEKRTGKLRPIRFIDADGKPFALKPGQTWVIMVPPSTPVWETVDSTDFYKLSNTQKPGSGFWASRFYASKMVEDEQVCVKVRGK
jgi:hypothetical protein